MKNGLINRPFSLYKVKDDAIGVTRQDYFSGKLIELSPEQADFYKKNPSAYFEEIMAMKIMPAVVVEIPIKERYAQRVRELISEKYTLEEELRILFNGISDPEFAEHELFVSEVKLQVKQELGINE